MQYISTRGQIEPVSFQDAVMMGLATDGGLLVPESFPQFNDKLDSLKDMSFQEVAFTLMREFATDMPEEDLRHIIEGSYSTFMHDDVTPVVSLKDLHILELFHGPTLAFKDVALQWLGNLFGYILKKRNGKLNILGATSGDTGSAAIHGVRGKDNINIFIMHPHGRTSPLQALQMTSVLDDNVHNIAVEGSFDDCQGIMKNLFNELDFKNSYHLGAVNSVNLARVLAQIIYYFYSYFRACESIGKPVNYCVPTGNFGDIFAGYMAKKMGLPVGKLILATNENNILERFFNTGSYSRSDVHFTLSPSMDIQVASNFERYLYYLCGEKSETVRDWMSTFANGGELSVPADENGVDSDFLAGKGDTEATLATIKKYWENENYLLDPHTAVGVYVAEQCKDSNPTVCLSTAHPAKFPDAIEKAIGEDIARHDSLEALKGQDTQFDILPADQEKIREYMTTKLG